ARFTLLSTDKAVEPIGWLGKTKRLAERYTASLPGARVVRLVNVRPSQGSVFEVWERQHALGQSITVSDAAITRHYMPVEDAAGIAIAVTQRAIRPAILAVPANFETLAVSDLVARFAQKHPTAEITFIGRGDGEKEAEKVCYPDEAAAALDDCRDGLAWRWMMMPQPSERWLRRLRDAVTFCDGAPEAPLLRALVEES